MYFSPVMVLYEVFKTRDVELLGHWSLDGVRLFAQLVWLLYGIKLSIPGMYLNKAIAIPISIAVILLRICYKGSSIEEARRSSAEYNGEEVPLKRDVEDENMLTDQEDGENTKSWFKSLFQNKQSSVERKSSKKSKTGSEPAKKGSKASSKADEKADDPTKKGSFLRVFVWNKDGGVSSK